METIYAVEYGGFFVLQHTDKYAHDADILNAEDGGYEVAKANAEYICEAVNSHASLTERVRELKEALKESNSFIHSVTGGTWGWYQATELQRKIETLLTSEK